MTKATYDKIPNYVKTIVAVLLFGGSCSGLWFGQVSATASVKNALEKQIIACNAKHEMSRAAQEAREIKLHEEIVRIDERGSKELQTYIRSTQKLEVEFKHLGESIRRIEAHLLPGSEP